MRTESGHVFEQETNETKTLEGKESFYFIMIKF